MSETPPAAGGLSSRGGLILAIVLAIVSTVGVMGPALASPRDTLLCNFIHPDCLSNHWLMVWVAEQVLSGGSILHNDQYYWPLGDAPWLAGNGSEGFAYAPWHWLFGWPLASNLHLALVLTLNGISAYTLARSCRVSPLAALAAVPSGTLMLFVVHELGAGRFSQASICWLTFFLASWIRLLDTAGQARGLGRAVASGVLLSLTALFYWYYALFGVIAGALLLAVWLGHRGLRGLPWVTLGVFVVTTLLFTGPLLWVFLDNWRMIPGTAEEVFPHPEVDGDSTWPGVPFLVSGGRHAGRALPLLTCVLALVGLRGLVRDRDWLQRGVLLVGVFFAALMAGSLLPYGPFELIYGLAAPLRRFWWPYRHVVVLNLMWITLAAMGAEYLVRSGSRLGRPWVMVALAVLVPVQLNLQDAPWHAQFTKTTVPHPVYAGIAELPGEVLIEPPLSPTVASDQAHLIYQLFHHKKLLRGHAMWVTRVRPEGWDEFVAQNSLLHEMQRLELAELGDGVFRFEEADCRQLIADGARIWVLNREYFPGVMSGLVAAYEQIFTHLFGPPIRSAGLVKVWDAAGYTGVTEVRFTPFVWPKGLFRNGPDLPIQSPRPLGPVFSVPGVPDKPGGRRPEGAPKPPPQR